MKFDIAAKLIGPNHRAWVVHAGRAQQHYNAFHSDNVVYLEVPHLRLSSDLLRSRGELRRSMRQALAWRRHSESTGSAEPSAALADYSDAVFEEKRLQTLSGSISRLYGQARKGDLVIVPGRDEIGGLFQPVVRFGEISSDFDPANIFAGTGPSSNNVPYRSVRWLSVVPRKNVSVRLDRRIGKPPAVREIKIDRDTEEILEHAYASFIFDNNSSSLVTAPTYEASDFVTLNKSSELIAFLVAAHQQFSGQQSGITTISNIEEFTKQKFQDARIENLEVSFASPGYWRIVGASVSLAAFVALGIAVLSSGLTADDLANGVAVINSAAPEDDTSQALQASMNYMLQSIDKIELNKAIADATKGKADIGLTSPTKVIP